MRAVGKVCFPFCRPGIAAEDDVRGYVPHEDARLLLNGARSIRYVLVRLHRDRRV